MGLPSQRKVCLGLASRVRSGAWPLWLLLLDSNQGEPIRPTEVAEQDSGQYVVVLEFPHPTRHLLAKFLQLSTGCGGWQNQ